MPETSAIGLHADLQEAVILLLADGFDSEAGRVRVGTDHGNRVARLLMSAISSNDGIALEADLRTFHFLPTAKATMDDPLRVK